MMRFDPFNRSLAGALLSTLALMAFSSEGAADPVQASADITVSLAGTVVGPGEVIDDLTASTPAPIDLGPLPTNVNVVAVLELGPTRRFFVVDSTVALPGGVVATPRDIVVYEDGTYDLEIAGVLLGFPPGSQIDGLAAGKDLQGQDAIFLSFDVAIDFSGLAVEPADVLNLFDTSLALDASEQGVPPGVDVDALSADGTDLLVSFDISGTVGGISFDDEDVLRFDPVNLAWSSEVDASAAQPGFSAAADVDAIHFVPEPRAHSLLLGGGLLLIVLAHHRRQDPTQRPRPS